MPTVSRSGNFTDMNTRLDLKLDKRAFLQWAEGREGHYELKENRVVMTTGGTKGHITLY